MKNVYILQRENDILGIFISVKLAKKFLKDVLGTMTGITVSELLKSECSITKNTLYTEL